jgi:hypothetical protein
MVHLYMDIAKRIAKAKGGAWYVDFLVCRYVEPNLSARRRRGGFGRKWT